MRNSPGKLQSIPPAMTQSPLNSIDRTLSSLSHALQEAAVDERSHSRISAFALLLLCFHPVALFTHNLVRPSTQLPCMPCAPRQWSPSSAHHLTDGALSLVASKRRGSKMLLMNAVQAERQTSNFLSRFDAGQSGSVETFAPRMGTKCIDGTDPDTPKVNQDAHFESRFCVVPDVFDSSSSWCFTVVSIMDGHGPKGHVVSNYLKKQLPLRIEEQISEMLTGDSPSQNDDLKEMEEKLVSLGQASASDFYLVRDGKEQGQDEYRIHRALVRAFHLAQLDAQKDKGVPTGRSGCTCVVVLFDEKRQRIYVAHVGDSLAVKASIAGNAASAQGESDVVVVNAQSVCNFDIQEERKRIEKSPEGRFDGLKTVCRAHLCVPMTRALGNSAMLPAGVLPTPIIEAVDLYEIHNKYQVDSPIYATKGAPSFNFLVLGTDGVFDVMSEQDVVQIVGKKLLEGGGAGRAAAAVAREARTRWVQDFPFDVRVDDITCSIILLPPPRPYQPSVREDRVPEIIPSFDTVDDMLLSDASSEAAQQVVDVGALYADAYSQVSRKTQKAVKLGQGEHGEVWKAEATDGSGTYAIKLIDIEEPGGFQVAEGEERGFRASDDLQKKAASLAESCGDDKASRNKWERAASSVVKYLHVAEDWSQIPSVCYVVMEYVEGQSLQDLGRSLSETQRMAVYIKLVEVIDLLSTNDLGTERAWVHRDIKPENVMANLEPGGDVNIKIVDLGVIVDRSTRQKNFYRGSNWPWVPFEQRKDPDKFAICDDECVSGFDMFSLGILILQLECGFQESRVISNPEETSSEEAQKIIDEFLATDLGQIVVQLTQADPCKRPRAPALLEALQVLHGNAELK